MKKKYLMEYRLGRMNAFSIILLIPIIIISYLCYKFNIFNLEVIFKTSIINDLFFLLMFIYLGVHECLHGLFYILNGAEKNNIKYGIALEKGILFCKCGQYVDNKCIKRSVMAPFWILGVIAVIISIIFKSIHLYILAVINILGCCADLVVYFWFVKRSEDIRFKEINDSSTFIVETSEDLSNKKFIFVKVKKILNEEPEDKMFLNKFNISSFSVYLLIFILIIFLILFFI